MIAVRELAAGVETTAADAVLPLHRLEQPRSEYLVAWDGERPVGHVCVEWSEPPELQDLWVLPDRRREGVATTLVAAVEERVAARGATLLRLNVAVGSVEAVRLYERLGYRRTATEPRRVRGTIVLRGRPIEIDDTLVEYAKRL